MEEEDDYFVIQLNTDDHTLEKISSKSLTSACIPFKHIPKYGDTLVFNSFPDCVSATVTDSQLIEWHDGGYRICKIHWEIWH